LTTTGGVTVATAGADDAPTTVSSIITGKSPFQGVRSPQCMVFVKSTSEHLQK
jgi:hypothetical protein